MSKIRDDKDRDYKYRECKIRANASAKRTKDKDGYETWLKNIEEQIKKILEEAEKTDEDEDKKYGANKRGDEISEKLKKKEKLRERE